MNCSDGSTFEFIPPKPSPKFVIPAKAGIQEKQRALHPLGPRFRGDDNEG